MRLIKFPFVWTPQNRSCSCSFPVVTTGTWHVRYSLAALGYDLIEYRYDILPPNGDVKGVGRTSKKMNDPTSSGYYMSTVEWYR